MTVPRIFIVAITTVVATACVDSKSENVDTPRAVFKNTGEAAHVDMVRIDSMAKKPLPSAAPNAPAPRTAPLAVPSNRTPSVIGETRRDAPVSRDPMPPLRGETSKGATMPVYRDSTRGPMMGIDPNGRVVPIKKIGANKKSAVRKTRTAVPGTVALADSFQLKLPVPGTAVLVFLTALSIL